MVYSFSKCKLSWSSLRIPLCPSVGNRTQSPSLTLSLLPSHPTENHQLHSAIIPSLGQGITNSSISFYTRTSSPPNYTSTLVYEVCVFPSKEKIHKFSSQWIRCCLLQKDWLSFWSIPHYVLGITSQHPDLSLTPVSSTSPFCTVTSSCCFHWAGEGFGGLSSTPL